MFLSGKTWPHSYPTCKCSTYIRIGSTSISPNCGDLYDTNDTNDTSDTRHRQGQNLMQHRKKKASVVEIVPAARALTHDAIANFVRVALLWHLQTAMEPRKVRAAERRERTDPDSQRTTIIWYIEAPGTILLIE